MKKWILNMYYPHEADLLTEYLERQAAAGWILKKVGLRGFLFEKAEPRSLRYCVDIPSVQRKRGGSNDYLQPYYEMCEEAGWTLVGTDMRIHVFVTEDPTVMPIHTDPSVRFEAAESFLKERISATILILVLCAALVLPVLPTVLQAQDSVLLYMAAVVLLGIGLGGELLYSYFQWKRCHEQALVTGDWKVSSSYRRVLLRSVLYGIFYVTMTVMYWYMLKVQLATGADTILDMARMLLKPPFRYIVICAGLYVGRRFFWKHGLDEASGRSISAVILWFLMVLVIAGAGVLQDNMDRKDSGTSAQVQLEKIKEPPFTAEMLGIHSTYNATCTNGKDDEYTYLEYIQILDGGGSLRYMYRLFGEENTAQITWNSQHDSDQYRVETEWVHYSEEWVDADLSALGTENATVLLYQTSDGKTTKYIYNIQKGNVQLEIEYTEGLLTEEQLQVIAQILP